MADLRSFIKELEEKDLLFRITELINKDTELMPLVRWQYKGLKDEQRKAFLFEKVTDNKGIKYNCSVAVSLLGTRKVYECAAGAGGVELRDRLVRALTNPVAPLFVDSENPPVQEEVHIGAGLMEHGGLMEFPVPVSTLGFDPAAFFTAAHWISQDPETGIRNVGTYRGMIKGPLKTGIMISPLNQMGMHIRKCREMGIKYLQAALVIGSPVEVGMLSVIRIPYGVDELAIAGGITGKPVRLAKCLTIDLMAPMDAEIVIEGRIPVDVTELEGPFGEFSGYMSAREPQPVFEVTCISHRKDPICQVYISEMPPSESSIMKRFFIEAQLYKLLKNDLGITSLTDVAVYDTCGSDNYCVIQFKKKTPGEVWQALRGVAAFTPGFGKFVVAVDHDIDLNDPDSVNWAMSYHTQPHRDIEILNRKVGILDPSCAPLTAPHSEQVFPKPYGNSIMLIDATRKWDYPPISLPPKDTMENAKKLWERMGLPPLTPKGIWYGYELGFWNDELRQLAKDALE